MRRLEDAPIDPEIAAALDAIDATLAGEPVDPSHAELAELALLLADERQCPEPAFENALDQRVRQRFARPSGEVSRARRRLWLWTPAAGLAAAVAVAVVLVSGGGADHARFTGAIAKAPERKAAAAPAAGVPQSSAPLAVPGQAGALQPPSNGRKIVQSAQLALSTSPGRVETVAQEVFYVVGQAKGVISSSSVTAGGGSGYAQFQLSVPSGSLPQTMAALSSLRYAHVASRTDTTQDVNDQYLGDQRRLADARALRTALLKQLARATTQAQIDSLTARIHDADASISSDEAALRRLNRQIDLSQVSLTISAGSSPVPAGHGSVGFTIGKAAHEAGRVLTVAAGVALIGLAALVPLALLGGVGWWIAGAVRRRRREQALDGI